MKLNVVSRRSAEKKEWDLCREDSRSNCQEWLPPKAARLRRVPPIRSRARASQSVLFRIRDSTPQCKIGSLQFNPDLTLLKPRRNAKALRYWHWGGTDHEELRDPRQRRGSSSSILRQLPKPLASHAHSRRTSQSSLAFLPRRIPAENDLPREALRWSLALDKANFLHAGRFLYEGIRNVGFECSLQRNVICRCQIWRTTNDERPNTIYVVATS